MNPDFALLGACALVAVVSVPLILKVVPPNPFYGFRTPGTLSNRSLWYRVNAFAGWALFFASVAAAAWIWSIHEGLLPSMGTNAVALVLPLGIALAASFAYLSSVEDRG